MFPHTGRKQYRQSEANQLTDAHITEQNAPAEMEPEKTMNHRRALRTSTDAGLTIFLVTIVGVVLWTTDEILNWNILPDWVDKYAQLLVIVLSILAAFSVLISIMCSFAVLAESAAEKSGTIAPTRSQGTRRLFTVGISVALGIMFGLHKLDQYRAEKRTVAEQQRAAAKFEEIQTGLNSRVPAILNLFSPEIKGFLAGEPTQNGDEAIALLLNAIKVSTPFDPSVSVLVAAKPPYTHCVITVLPQQERESQANGWKHLRRQCLTGFPSDWEHDAILSGFGGKKLDLPRGRSGVFINADLPSCWGTLTRDGRAIGIIMLRGSM